MHKSVLALTVALAFAAPIVSAQAPSGAAAVKATEPGKVALAEAVQVAATVQAIDKPKRLVTLKGPEGNTFVVEAGPEVRNFDQIKGGDQVVARYIEAITLELKKGTGGIRERVEREGAAAAKPGERPGVAAGRQITAVADVVVRALVRELQARFDKAGVVVEEARLTHLAYAPEIAQVMLRRQQAEAIISARTKIVTGAVSMVEMALHELSAKAVVHLDDERKASMVNNLMTVLCAESDVQPVINTGTLYN